MALGCGGGSGGRRPQPVEEVEEADIIEETELTEVSVEAVDAPVEAVRDTWDTLKDPGKAEVDAGTLCSKDDDCKGKGPDKCHKYQCGKDGYCVFEPMTPDEEKQYCDDGLPCTIDLCAPDTGCTHIPGGQACTPCDSDTACDDLDPCTFDQCVPCPTGADCGGTVCANLRCPACKAGTCVEVSCGPDKVVTRKQKDCSDQDPCTLDWCREDTGECRHDAVPKELCFPCNTEADCKMLPALGDLCLVPTCQAQLCDYGAASCEDLNPCTADRCVASSGCYGVDVCASCKEGSGPAACDDMNACTSDACVQVGDVFVCRHAPV